MTARKGPKVRLIFWGVLVIVLAVAYGPLRVAIIGRSAWGKKQILAVLAGLLLIAVGFARERLAEWRLSLQTALESRFRTSQDILLSRVLVLITFAIILARNVYLLFPYTVDDSFIFLTYGRNLARGCGLVFNCGAPPVEAYTSFLWAVISAVPFLSGTVPPPVIYVKITGLVFLLASLLLIYNVALSIADNTFSALATLAIIGSLPHLALASVVGMDTILFVFLHLFFVYLLVRAVDRQRWQSFFHASIIGFLLYLGRPEGIIVFCFTLLYFSMLLRKRVRGRNLLVYMFVFLLPATIYSFWKLNYYGSLLPHTVIAKSLELSAYLMKVDGLLYGTFVLAKDNLALVPLGLLGVYMAWNWRVNSKVILLFICSIPTIATYYLHGDWMAGLRLALPGLVLIVLLGCMILFEKLRAVERWANVFLCVYIAALSIGVYDLRGFAAYHYNIQGSQAQLMGELIGALKYEDSILVTPDAGVVPFYADINTIDNHSHSLLTPYLTKNSDPNAVLDYILDREPDFIIITTSSIENISPMDLDNALARDSRFEGYHYIQTAMWRPDIPEAKVRRMANYIDRGYYYLLFVSERVWNRYVEMSSGEG